MSSEAEADPEPKRQKTDISDKGSNRIDPLFAKVALSDERVMKAYPGMEYYISKGSCPGGCTPDNSSSFNRQFCKTCGFSVF